jgi:hypothetical protein
MNEYRWVPVLNDDNDEHYIPGKYLKEDIYTGVDCLPMYDNKEDCEQWCFNKNYVGRWLKTLKRTQCSKYYVFHINEHNMPSLKPGDYIQIKEIVDGIGIGYVDDVKYLLFNTKHIDSLLSLWELMPQDFNPHVAPKVKAPKSIIEQITDLENQSFEGWSEDAINGYLTACKTIKEKL